MYEVDKLPQSIDIGYTGEIDFRTVQIDMSAWVDKVPGGTPTLMHIRPGEYNPYPVEITYANNVITWSVSDEDLGTREGTGLLQVWFGVQDEAQVMRQLGMSVVVPTIIHMSIAGEGRNSSTVQIPWLKEVMELKNIILGYDYEAESWANGKRGGVDVENTDPAYHNNAKYYKEQVEDMASDSEAFAAGTRGGEDVDEDDPAYENNAKYYNEQAALEKAAAQAAAETASAAYNVNLLAANYDATKTYAVGEYVIYSGGLYRCISAITTAEAWTAAHWSSVTVGKDTSALKSAFDDVTEYALNSFVTPGIDNTASGVTRKTSSDGEKLILYGEASASRRICFLNGQNAVKITSSDFSKTLDAGTYLIETDMTGYESGYSFEATYTTYANPFRIVDSTNKSAVIAFTAPVMIGIVAASGRNYGTEENPTYVTFTAKKLTAVDIVARGEAEKVQNAVLFDQQALESAQQAQARENIDGVGNETIFKYNACNVLDYDQRESGTHKGVTYTNNGNGTWTIDGEATDTSYFNFFGALSEVKRCIIPGRKYRFNFNGGSIPVRVYIYRNGSVDTATTYTTDFEVALPTDLTGFLIRFQLEEGVDVDNVTVRYTFIPVTNTSINNSYTYNTTVNKTVEQVENTFNMTVSPTITTDTNGWLQSVNSRTSDESGKTDMTPAIMAMLTETGYCHLGEGVFYVSGNIDMPEGSRIEGCGYNTIIQLLSSVESGYCVRMQKRNTISNLRINGAFSSITIDGTQGTRTGILFVANEDGQEGGAAFDSECCMVNNVWIDNFSDSGIKCHNTSISTFRGMYATNVYIARCWAAINIDYYSEFHKFTNVCTYSSWYGCINNGGNNVFTACTFNAYYIGFYIDGTQPNAAHGTINGCTFCHIGSNNGTAIKVENIVAGYIIANCQIWYCGIEVVNCRGVLFDGCEFGRGKESDGSVCASISVSGGELTMFNGCIFHLDATRPPKITITNNTMTVFEGCYGTESGLPITAP